MEQHYQVVTTFKNCGDEFINIKTSNSDHAQMAFETVKSHIYDELRSQPRQWSAVELRLCNSDNDDYDSLDYYDTDKAKADVQNLDEENYSEKYEVSDD